MRETIVGIVLICGVSACVLSLFVSNKSKKVDYLAELSMGGLPFLSIGMLEGLLISWIRFF
jgi:hypothetical protein